MSDYKAASTSFLLGVKLEEKCFTPLVDVTLYRNLVGSLIYLTHTHPDIPCVVGMVSHFMQELHELHWKETKYILHYIEGTYTYKICYVASTRLQLVGYTNSNYVGDIDSCKCTLGYMFHLGSSPIFWHSKKQNTIALSPTKAEYRGAVNATTEAIQLQQIQKEFGFDLA